MPASWDAHVLGADAQIPDVARRAVLGGRRAVMFVEGSSTSLDRNLLSLLFPERTVVPAGGSLEVIRAVRGLNATSEHHWLEASGVIDGDRHLADEVSALADESILVLKVSEIENLYYTAPIMSAMAAWGSSTFSIDEEQLFQAAVDALFDAFDSAAVRENLVRGVALKDIYESAIRRIPKKEDLGASDVIQITLDDQTTMLRKRLEAVIEARDNEALLAEFPIRESPARDKVAKAMRFQSYQHYEDAVIVRVQQDEELRSELMRLICG